MEGPEELERARLWEDESFLWPRTKREVEAWEEDEAVALDLGD